MCWQAALVYLSERVLWSLKGTPCTSGACVYVCVCVYDCVCGWGCNSWICFHFFPHPVLTNLAPPLVNSGRLWHVIFFLSHHLHSSLPLAHIYFFNVFLSFLSPPNIGLIFHLIDSLSLLSLSVWKEKNPLSNISLFFPAAPLAQCRREDSFHVLCMHQCTLDNFDNGSILIYQAEMPSVG